MRATDHVGAFLAPVVVQHEWVDSVGEAKDAPQKSARLLKAWPLDVTFGGKMFYSFLIGLINWPNFVYLLFVTLSPPLNF